MAAGIEVAASGVSIAYDWRASFPDAQIRGVSGATIDFTASMYDKRPTGKIILIVGYNDLAAGSSVESIAEKYANLVSQLPGEVFCIGVPPVDRSKSDPWHPNDSWLGNDRIASLNERIREICGNDHYIDTHALLGADDTNDGIHPNREGYQTIAGEMSAMLVSP